MPLEEDMSTLCAILNMSHCFDGRSPYSRNYFQRNRSLPVQFRLYCANYKFLADRIKSLHPDREKAIREKAFSALKKYATLANLPLILYFSLQSNYGRHPGNLPANKK